MYIKMMKGIWLLIAVLGFSLQGAAQENPLRTAPPYKANKFRKFQDVPVAQLVEGSPEWVFWKLMLASKAMDFVDLGKYQSPIGVWGAKKNTPEKMAMLMRVDLDGSLRVDDHIYDGDACCVYMGFKGLNDGPWQLMYRYFLKIDGKWMRVTDREWASGKLEPVPGSERQ